jgi:hypothetical protein
VVPATRTLTDHETGRPRLVRWGSFHDHGGFHVPGGRKSSVIMAGFRVLVIGK